MDSVEGMFFTPAGLTYTVWSFEHYEEHRLLFSALFFGLIIWFAGKFVNEEEVLICNDGVALGLLRSMD